MKSFVIMTISMVGLAACGMGTSPATPATSQMCAARAQAGARQPGAETQYQALYQQCMVQETGQAPTSIPTPPTPEAYVAQ